MSRFLWVKDVEQDVCEDNILHLRFCRVLFGAISSPFLLNARLKHHLEKPENPIKIKAAKDIRRQHDYRHPQHLGTVEMYQTCKQSFNELTMNLRGWYSNLPEFIDTISKEDRGKQTEVVNVLLHRCYIESKD